jgi:hypothetical protein
LIQTKNKVIDLVQGTAHLNGENHFSITDAMDEETSDDKIKYQQLQHC